MKIKIYCNFYTLTLLIKIIIKNIQNLVGWLSGTYTMMLLMGMWMSFTKNPMKPMIANPIAVAMAIFWNSAKHIQSKVRKCASLKLNYCTPLSLLIKTLHYSKTHFQFVAVCTATYAKCFSLHY